MSGFTSPMSRMASLAIGFSMSTALWAAPNSQLLRECPSLAEDQLTVVAEARSETTEAIFTQLAILKDPASGDMIGICRIVRNRSNEELIESVFYTLGELNNGAVIQKDGKHETLVMKGRNISSSSGGVVELDYLHNGIWGSRKSTNFEMRRIKGSAWILSHQDQQVFDLKVVPHRTFFGMLVGVENIVPLNSPHL